MNTRFTKKMPYGYSLNCKVLDIDFISKANIKFGTLEDVEQTIGVDLAIWATAMHNGVYVKGKEREWSGLGSKQTIEHYDVLYFTKDMLAIKFNDFCDTHYIDSPLKKFRRVWALSETDFISSKKDELVGVEPRFKFPFPLESLISYKFLDNEKLAIDIIKKKSVNCRLLIDCKTSLHRYNKMCCQARQLTEYEFDVLLKVLTGGIVCHS